jgi:hypothetical protein
MRVEYNIKKVQDTSYPLAQYELLDVHSPVAPGLTSSADPPRRCLRAHCGSARLGSPVTGHHNARARRHDGIVRRLRTVYGDTTRRLGNRRAYRGVSLPAPCVSGRPYFLTWARPAHLPAFNAVVGLETREGPPAMGMCRAIPAPTAGAARGGTGPLPGGRGVRAPEAGRSDQACGGLASTRGGSDLPGESGSAGATREPPCLHGHVDAPDL